MFKSARLKLTILYLGIIMLISIAFSAVIYQTVTSEFRLRLGAIEKRLNRQEPPFKPSLGNRPFAQDLNDAKERVILVLLYANTFILITSGVAGYFLAGRTLKPIEKALEEQKRFTADASHELKTPLTSLKTSMEVALRDKKMSIKNARNIIKNNLEDVNALEILTNNLLTLAHHNNNGKHLKFENINLKKTLESTCKKILPQANKKNIKIEKDLEDIELEADKNSLEKMVLTLLENAVKYTQKGGKISLNSTQKGKHILITVKDNGPGIAEGEIAHIFDRFYRVDQSRSKQKANGFGLGLSLAKEIAESYSGSIKVESIEKIGSSFTIRIPLKRS